ncbi:MAG: anaerobic ribonucleoside-triphosphate reductase activating protein [Patescibacteria group bacterium]
MIVGGFQKFSLIDYPDRMSAVIFTRGCNFRCKYCHNPELVIPEKFTQDIPLSEIYSFLESRQNKIEAVVITGGEPTEHSGIDKFMANIKDMGFLTKLDTNGTRPLVIESLFKKGVVDYIAMDIKAPLHNYPVITCRPVVVEDIKKSIELIINSGTEHEFRTTVIRDLISEKDLQDIAKEIKGARKYYLQRFVPSKTVDPKVSELSLYEEGELQKIAKELKGYFEECDVR